MKKAITFSGLIILICLSFGCKKQPGYSITIPEMVTNKVLEISQTTAVSGGIVETSDLPQIASKGVCWSTSPDPTISDNTTIDLGQSVVFVSSLNNLSPNTKYYVRSYAANKAGTGYGSPVIFTTISSDYFKSGLAYGTVTDIDNNIYKTLTIGAQTWMAQNLRTTRYRNGDLIGTTNSASADISKESKPEYQWSYNGNENNTILYGRLYTWYAANDTRNVCPVGWHLPDSIAWKTMTDYLTNNGYGFGVDGNAIAKSMAVSNAWYTDSIPGNTGNDQSSNNSSGFTAFPAGERGLSNYGLIGISCFWWTSTERSSTFAARVSLYSVGSKVSQDNNVKTDGYAVRCIKD